MNSQGVSPGSPVGRLAAVRRYEILDAPRDGTFDRIARIAAAVRDVPIATVTIVDEDRVWFAACEGLDGVSQVGTGPGLCASAVIQDAPYVMRRWIHGRWTTRSYAESWGSGSTPRRRSSPPTGTGWAR